GVEDDELVDALGSCHGEVPGDAAAPVVSGNSCPFRAGVADQLGDVLAEEGETVGRGTTGLVREVVAAQVRGEDAVTGGGEGRELEAPAVPEFGEPVQQNNQRPLPRLDIMQAHAVDHCLAVVPVSR